MGKLIEHYLNVLEVLLSMYSVSQLSFSLCTVMKVKLNNKRFLPMKISFPLALAPTCKTSCFKTHGNQITCKDNNKS